MRILIAAICCLTALAVTVNGAGEQEGKTQAGSPGIETYPTETSGDIADLWKDVKIKKDNKWSIALPEPDKPKKGDKKKSKGKKK